MTRPQYRLALVAASRQGHYLEQADLSGFLAVFARKAAEQHEPGFVVELQILDEQRAQDPTDSRSKEPTRRCIVVGSYAVDIVAREVKP